VTDTDLTLVNEIFDKNNTLVLITKNDITKQGQREGMTNYLIKKGVSEDMIIPVSEEDNDSLIKVMKKTYNLLPEAYIDAFMSAQVLSLEDKDSKAKTFIHTAAVIAAAAATIPIPTSDTFVITSAQVVWLQI